MRKQVPNSQAENLQTHDFSVMIMSKKSRQLNWEHGKIIIFIQAQKVEHLATCDQVDPCDEFETIITKWKKDIAFMMKVGYSSHMRNGPTCKDKWGIINNDFKWIFGNMAKKKHIMKKIGP